MTWPASPTHRARASSWTAWGPFAHAFGSSGRFRSQFIALPMEIASGIGRCMSPAAAVVIAVTGMGDLKLADVVKRCVAPCIFLFVVNLVVCAVVCSLIY